MSKYICEDGSYNCPICGVNRHNLPLMMRHLDFWHELRPVETRKVINHIDAGREEPVVLRQGPLGRRAYIDQPLPGF